MTEFKIGQIVHVNADNEEWGRIASDGMIFFVDKETTEILVNVFSIKANIWVDEQDLTLVKDVDYDKSK